MYVGDNDQTLFEELFEVFEVTFTEQSKYFV